MDEVKYIKRGYIRDVEYMAVLSTDSNFYKGWSIFLDKTEKNVLAIEFGRWMNFKSVAYCTVEITKNEFYEKLELSIEFLKSKK